MLMGVATDLIGDAVHDTTQHLRIKQHQTCLSQANELVHPFQSGQPIGPLDGKTLTWASLLGEVRGR